MVDTNKALIVVVLDRSGSMQTIQKDMVGGFARFVEEQRAQPGQCEMSLYQFDDAYDVVYERKPIADVPPLALVPRGSTALLDAVGKTIAAVGEQLAAAPEAQRPGAVVVLVITDGHENASKEWTRAKVAALVREQEKSYNWRFVYLGADAAAFAEAASMGIAQASSYSTQNVGGAYGATSRGIGSFRSAVRSGNLSASVPVPKDLSEEK